MKDKYFLKKEKLADLLEQFSSPHSETSAAYQVNFSLYPGETEIQPTQEIIIHAEE